MNAISPKSRISTSPSVTDDLRWARIVARDKTADGHLWYSVVTTGIYRRPSCPSRTANPKNVRLHDSLESAKATGFRACKRCNPDGLALDSENADLVAKACRIIEESEEEPRSRSWRPRSAAVRVIFTASSRPPLVSRLRNTSRRIARRGCGLGWRAAAPLPRRSTTQAIIRADAFMKSRPTCSA